MDIKNKTILVLGGWGLVGSAVVRRLAAESPKHIVVTSRLKREAVEAAALFAGEYPRITFTPWWGDVFVQTRFKDTPREELLQEPKKRRALLHDVFDDLTDDILRRNALYTLITTTKPDIIIDCINTATAIAYQDVFTAARSVLQDLDSVEGAEAEHVERLIASMYIPQLIRHVQIVYQAVRDANTGMYLKIGTSGTGGMGLNIPYTHSEERPSRVLLSKSAVAGAHTLLMFLMGRSPDAPIVKEIKPTATIGWKNVGFGEVRKHGKRIDLVDCAAPVKLGATLRLRQEGIETPLGRPLTGVFIDTGENGIFARGEFETVTALRQMEMVTPEEIAENVAREVRGLGTGKDIVAALDSATMEPTYRAGVMRSMALEQLARLERLHESDSIAFEMLGPPRLSKLLFEAHLLQRVCPSMRELPSRKPQDIATAMREVVTSDADLRSRIISIGIPILLPDGRSMLRANRIKIPPERGVDALRCSPAAVNAWAEQGWVDLRAANVTAWQRRIASIIASTTDADESTGSRFARTAHYWNDFESVPVGKLAAWIFSEEDNGARMKP